MEKYWSQGNSVLSLDHQRRKIVLSRGKRIRLPRTFSVLQMTDLICETVGILVSQK